MHVFSLSSALSLLLSTTLVSGAAIRRAEPTPSPVPTSSAVTVCTSTQCLQGTPNTTFGAVLSGNVLLLPDSYGAVDTLPPPLRQALSSPLASITVSPQNAGLVVSAQAPPLTVGISLGILTFTGTRFSGSGAFTAMSNSTTNGTSVVAASVNATSTSTNQTISLGNVGSVVVADGIFVVMNTNSSGGRVVLWETVPDMAQLPSATGSSPAMSLVTMQSTSCTTPCSTFGTCSSAGKCVCPPGFTGDSCENCAPGFFGSRCQPCPANCPTCDQGLIGSGRCLAAITPNPPSSCNCVNGACGSGGTCTCNPGWQNAPAGSTGQTAAQCSVCANGFFDNGAGDCKVCSQNCVACTSGGSCTQCRSGFVPNPNDPTQCVPQVITNAATCPDGSFNQAGTCVPCSPLCKTCTGPTSADCIVCGAGRVMDLQNSCATTDNVGRCTGTNLVADNQKNRCDACPSKCTSCQIPNFSVVSTISQVQCTACLPGFVLQSGKCLEKCVDGFFVDSSTNTCVACDSSCATCAGSKNFCLTCSSTNSASLASNGTCVQTCPSGTFSTTGACLPCHSDCASCSGPNFNQCTSCPASRPVVGSGGRCLLTCGKKEYFDATSGGCKACDGSCSSCSGPGPNQCLACEGTNKGLRSGSCVDSECTSGSSVIKSLGICLSDLVAVPSTSGTTVTVSTPTAVPILLPSQNIRLEWWQILLIAVGGVSATALTLIIWRHRARKNRANQTAAFARAIQNGKSGRWFKWFGFGAKTNKNARPMAMTDLKDPGRYRDSLSESGSEIDGWRKGVERSDSQRSRPVSQLTDVPSRRAAPGSRTARFARPTSITSDESWESPLDGGYRRKDERKRFSAATSAPSMYSQMTTNNPIPPNASTFNNGLADGSLNAQTTGRSTPPAFATPRQPVKGNAAATSLFGALGTDQSSTMGHRVPAPSDAQLIDTSPAPASDRPAPTGPFAFLASQHTGASTASNRSATNPFYH